MAVTAIFADGSMIVGDSYRALEQQMRDDEWNPSNKEKFRNELTLRAWNWSRTAVGGELTARRFMQGLERAGILRLEVVPR